MARPSKPWLLPVICAALGVLWVLWLASGTEGTRDKPAEAPAQAQSAAPSGPSERPATAPQVPRPQASTAPVAPSSERRAASSPAPPASDAPVHLVFQAPPTVRIGENFDVRVAIAGRQPVGRIVVELVFDPLLLRMRLVEELDSAVRGTEDRAFSISQSMEGQVELVLNPRRRQAALEIPATVPLVQFEAIQQGTTQLRIPNVSAFDPGDRSLSWAAVGQEIQVVVN